MNGDISTIKGMCVVHLYVKLGQDYFNLTVV